MTTLPHQNPDNGYAIRISQHLPEDAVNLSYVHVDTPTPSKNINLKDHTGQIPENTAQDSSEVFHTHVNEEGVLELDQRVFKSPTPHLLLTNEYANNLSETPLFYVYKTQLPFDTDNIQVSVPISGNRLSAPAFLHDYREGEHTRFVYEGDKVHLTRSNGLPLEKEDVFKLVLEKEDDGYRLFVYSAQTLLDSGYEIHYPGIADGRSINTREIVNLSPVFKEETQVKDTLSPNNYRVIENDDTSFSLQVDKTAGDFLITEEERAPYTFDYQLEATVSTRLGDKNPYEAQVGIIYLNDSIHSAIETTAALKKLVYNNPLMPDYLSFDNPHPRYEGVNHPTDIGYWEASITMPLEHWLDYDLLILSGYGTYDMTPVRQSLESYMDAGGLLLVESAGQEDDVLELENNPLTQVSYSSNRTEDGALAFAHISLADRYYDLSHLTRLPGDSPSFNYTGRESELDWVPYIQYNQGGYGLMKKKSTGPGQLFYSNLNLLMGVLFNRTEALELMTNFFLVLFESRTFTTPVYSDYVFHKDDLYAEEYQTEHGKDLYVNATSDEDQTQVVAKKIINTNMVDQVRPYLPDAYRNGVDIQVTPTLFDKEQITLKNNRFTQSGASQVFHETDVQALPGFRYISFEGNQGIGRHLTDHSQLQVDTDQTHAFFEQEVGRLTPGYYELQVRLKSDWSNQAGFGLYDAQGEAIEVQTIVGEVGWTTYHLDFHIDRPQTVYIRLGSHGGPGTARLTFSEVFLYSQGAVRLSPPGARQLYAYAITPKGKTNQLVAYEQTYSNPSLIKENRTVEADLRVRSFTYRWFSEERRYRKQYGNEKTTPVTMDSRDRHIILGNVLSYLPPLASGVEWSRKQNVYYEFVLEGDAFASIHLYDPTIDHYFFNAQGEWVLNHNDIWWNGFDSTVQVRMESDFYHLIATENKMAVTRAPHREMKVFLPYTEDERDRWHLRIRNSTFTKSTLRAGELEELSDLNKAHHYDNRLIGEHVYALPEYRRQAFYPYDEARLVSEEQAVYVNSNKIEVQQTPLLLTEETVDREALTPNTDRTVWAGQHILWRADVLPQVYVDQHNTGQLLLLNDGYQIDYREGKVISEQPIEGTLYASYRHDNFKVYTRNYQNKNVSGERLTTRDGFTFHLKEENITVMPAPVLYEGHIEDARIISPSAYWVDYKAGSIHFFTQISGRVYADYHYFTEEELKVEDVNINTGEIYLKDPVSFKDSVYVTYLAQEDTLEYKGYYDEELDRFIHLDLNPTSGHQFDYVTDGGVESLEGQALLDKEIFVYLLPHRSLYYKTDIQETHPLRHVFHETEWRRIKEAHPEALLLTQLQVRENTNKDNIVMMDARRPGGGLKDHLKEDEIQERLGYTNAFWDIGTFDGLAYYKNGVLVVQVPAKVLKENGGHSTEDEIRRILDKYMAYGTYPIIEFTEEDDIDILTRKEGYYVIYEQPKNTVTIDQYTGFVYQKLVDLEEEYFISETEFVYTRTYTSEKEESVIHYNPKYDTKTLHIELYADKELTELIGIEKIPVIQDGKITIESNGNNEFEYIFRGDRK